MGHLDAISVIVLVGCKENLRLKECIREAVQFHFYSAAALLLVCYAAKHVKKELLKYLMGLQLQDEEKDAALADLPYKPVLQLNMEQMRWDKKIGSSIHAHTYTHARTHTHMHARTLARTHTYARTHARTHLPPFWWRAHVQKCQSATIHTFYDFFFSNGDRNSGHSRTFAVRTILQHSLISKSHCPVLFAHTVI